VIVVPELQKPLELYSQVVVHESMVYVSAVQGFIPGTLNLPSDDVEEQAKFVFQNLRTLLRGAGSDLKFCVKATLFLKDMQDFPKANKYFNEAFPVNPPARTSAQVVLPRNCRVAVEVIAYIPKPKL